MLDLISNLKQGTVLNNKELCRIFSCAPQGGMRRSHSTNTLVVVSNHVSSIYDDRWLGEIFHYTGMGTKGDQRLDFAQNKTLFESNSNGISVHLFEVFEEKKYFYVGEMELSSQPYFEKQIDEDGFFRQACVFPLRPKNIDPPLIGRDYVCKSFERKSKQARKLKNEEIELRAKNVKRTIGTRKIVSIQFDRDPWVAEYARRMANGICQLCDLPAPFNNKEGVPYLENHHIVWLARGGEDTIENTVALCPACHRKMHVLDNEKDVLILLSKKQGNN